MLKNLICCSAETDLYMTKTNSYKSSKVVEKFSGVEILLDAIVRFVTRVALWF